MTGSFSFCRKCEVKTHPTANAITMDYSEWLKHTYTVPNGEIDPFAWEQALTELSSFVLPAELEENFSITCEDSDNAWTFKQIGGFKKFRHVPTTVIFHRDSKNPVTWNTSHSFYGTKAWNFLEKVLIFICVTFPGMFGWIIEYDWDGGPIYYGYFDGTQKRHEFVVTCREEDDW
jgi:hypothetical protein